MSAYVWPVRVISDCAGLLQYISGYVVLGRVWFG